MITLDRESLTNLLIANREDFSEFPIVEAFCVAPNPSAQDSRGKLYALLVAEISSESKLKRAIEQCVGAPFQIDASTYEIFNGAELCALIRDNSITISEGEETWIGNLERIQQSLKEGACCSARSSLTHETHACYADLVNQCDSSWIFVRNIKDFVSAESLSFTHEGATSKTE